jgi:hypothetical protein
MSDFKYEDLNNFARLSEILETGKSRIILNVKQGVIHIDKGLTGKNGYGLLNIIENKKDRKYIKVKKDEETTAFIHLVSQAVQDGKKIKSLSPKDAREKGRCIQLEKNGIIALISLPENDNEKKRLLSGYVNIDKKEEAAEAIQTVIAKYSYTPEFSDFRKQVGAVVSSLQISQRQNEMSREIETAKKAGYVQGVCECVAAICENHTLGKKLLTEMNVTKDMAKRFASPETFKTLGKGIFASKPEQKQEQTNNIKR